MRACGKVRQKAVKNNTEDRGWSEYGVPEANLLMQTTVTKPERIKRYVLN